MFNNTEEFNQLLDSDISIDMTDRPNQKNYFDELWYTIFNITRSAMYEATKSNIKTERLYSTFNDDVYQIDQLLDKLKAMSNEEYVFQYKNSFIGHGGKEIFDTHISSVLMDFAGMSPSFHTDTIATKDWLMATLGLEKGLAEYQHRCTLINKLDYNTEILLGLFDYFTDKIDSTSIEELTPNDEVDSTLSDTILNILSDSDLFDTSNISHQSIDNLINDIDFVLLCKESGCNYYTSQVK